MKKHLLAIAGLMATMGMSALTYTVTVPSETKACYICGDCTEWVHMQMTQVTTTKYTIDIAEAQTTDVYKYCSGPGWSYVEKTATGDELANRSYSANDVVEKWSAVYDPGFTPEYVDINVMIKNNGQIPGSVPTIWWWGAGAKCPNADSTNDPETGKACVWPGPHMVLANGWYVWSFKDVDKSLGVTMKLSGDNGPGEVNAKQDLCYEVNSSVWNIVECPCTSVKDVEYTNVYSANGTIFAEGELQIFSLIGHDVTKLNGQLSGIYVVKTAKGTQKIVVE